MKSRSTSLLLLLAITGCMHKAPDESVGIAAMLRIDSVLPRTTREGCLRLQHDPRRPGVSDIEGKETLRPASGRDLQRVTHRYGRIEGVNFAETSVGFGETGRLFPKGFSFEIYRDAIITNMKALKRAFPKSVAMQYGNFMPGEWRPTNDKGYLRAVYEAAKESGVGVGGPDLMPHRPGQLGSSYPLIREAAGIVPKGCDTVSQSARDTLVHAQNRQSRAFAIDGSS